MFNYIFIGHFLSENNVGSNPALTTKKIWLVKKLSLSLLKQKSSLTYIIVRQKLKWWFRLRAKGSNQLGL